MLIFGLGYAAGAVAAALRADGWDVAGTTRDGRDGTVAFDDRASVEQALGRASHVLSSVPPDAGGDPVLVAYGSALPRRPWLGYLSSTGVYGDTGGAWVDEGAPIRGRRRTRNAADAAWLALGARVFRLPGIYGPGRSPLERARAGTAHRTGLADQVFSRIHVADIASGVIAALAAPPGAYNLADDEPASADAVAAYAAALIGLPPPPLVPLAALSPAARAFYAENRRVANGRAKRVLGWTPAFPDYRAGLRALSATTSPNPVRTAPDAARVDHR